MSTIYILMEVEPYSEQPRLIKAYHDESGAETALQSLASGKDVGCGIDKYQYFVEPVEVE